MDLCGRGFHDSKDPIFSDSTDPLIIFSDSKDAIFNSMDPNRVTKSLLKTWRYVKINVLNVTESGAFSKPSLFHSFKRFQQVKLFPDFIHLLSCVGIFRR